MEWQAGRSVEDRLCAVLHHFWAGAFIAMMKVAWPRNNGAVQISAQWIEKWKKMSHTHYNFLPESDKEHYRRWLRRHFLSEIADIVSRELHASKGSTILAERVFAAAMDCIDHAVVDLSFNSLGVNSALRLARDNFEQRLRSIVQMLLIDHRQQEFTESPHFMDIRTFIPGGENV